MDLFCRAEGDRGALLRAQQHGTRELGTPPREVCDFLKWFDGYFISGLEGVIKPDPEYSEMALERLEPAARRGASLSMTARRTSGRRRCVGIPAVVFTSPEALRGGLVGRGLLGPRSRPSTALAVRSRISLRISGGCGEIEPGEAHGRPARSVALSSA